MRIFSSGFTKTARDLRYMFVDASTLEFIECEKDIVEGQNALVVSYDNNLLDDQELYTNLISNKPGRAVDIAIWLKECGVSAKDSKTLQDIPLENFAQLIMGNDFATFWDSIASSNDLYNSARESELRDRDYIDDQRPGAYELYGPDPQTPQF